MSSTTRRLSDGVWGVLATPFRERGRVVDLESFRHQVMFYHEVDATGVVALGVFGEAAKLEADERLSIIQTVASAATLPVVVGLPSLETELAIIETTAARDALGDQLAGVMVQVNNSDPATVIKHMQAIHVATGAGVVIQDYPLVSSVHIASNDLARVIEACPFIVAVKAEAPPTSPVVARLAPGSDVPVFGGLGGVGLIDELAAGAAGAMTGFSHPEGLVEAVNAYQEGGFTGAQRAFKRWLPLANFEGQAGIGLAIRKEILRRRGIIAEAWVREPGQQFPESLEHILDQHLSALSGEASSGVG